MKQKPKFEVGELNTTISYKLRESSFDFLVTFSQEEISNLTLKQMIKVLSIIQKRNIFKKSYRGGESSNKVTTQYCK